MHYTVIIRKYIICYDIKGYSTSTQLLAYIHQTNTILLLRAQTYILCVNVYNVICVIFFIIINRININIFMILRINKYTKRTHIISVENSDIVH